MDNNVDDFIYHYRHKVALSDMPMFEKIIRAIGITYLAKELGRSVAGIRYWLDNGSISKKHPAFYRECLAKEIHSIGKKKGVIFNYEDLL